MNTAPQNTGTAIVPATAYASIIEFMKVQPGKVIARERAEDALKIMNGEFAVVPIGGTPVVVHRFVETVSGRTRNAEKYYKPSAFVDLLRHVKVKVEIGERITTKPLAELWLSWPERTQFAGIGFYPGGEPSGYLNLWRGFAVEAIEGDWSLLREHVRVNICNGVERDFRWLMSWMAQIVQEPHRKVGSAVVLRGAKGTGKSKLFDWFGGLLGRHTFVATLAEHIVGRFNGHMQDCLLLRCEEGFWAGNKQAEGRLKDLITGSRIAIERKGIDATTEYNFTRVAITSNEAWVVPATADERRFFVLDVSDARARDTTYFAAIDVQMEDGGAEAMLHELMTWDFNQVDLRNPPKTAALVQQVVEGMRGLDRWWHDVMLTGNIVDASDIPTTYELATAAQSEVPSPALVRAVEPYMSRRGQPADAAAVGRWLKLNVPGVVRRRPRPSSSPAPAIGSQRPYTYLFPPLDVMRAVYSAKLGIAIDPSVADVAVISDLEAGIRRAVVGLSGHQIRALMQRRRSRGATAQEAAVVGRIWAELNGHTALANKLRAVEVGP